MGRQHSKRRSLKIRQNKKRRAKLAKLRQQYAVGKVDKDKILEKAFKISPGLTDEEFLKYIKKPDKEIDK